MKLDDLAKLAKDDTEPTFWQRFPSPALVFLMPSRRKPYEETPRRAPAASSREGSTTDTTDDDAPSREQTVEHGRHEVSGESAVLFLDTVGSQTERVTIGRSPRNHICLSPPSISKTHASLEFSSTIEFDSTASAVQHRRDHSLPGSSTGWTVRDEHSRNGTFVQGERLPSGASAPLIEGGEVGFGPDVRVRFFTPQGLYGFLALYNLGVLL